MCDADVALEGECVGERVPLSPDCVNSRDHAHASSCDQKGAASDGECSQSSTLSSKDSSSYGLKKLTTSKFRKLFLTFTPTGF